eukprot:jgi/Mesvir1/16374/Mv18121-RA.1
MGEQRWRSIWAGHDIDELPWSWTRALWSPDECRGQRGAYGWGSLTNKGAVMCRAERGRLVDAHRDTLLALRGGFLPLDDLLGDQLKLLSGQGMAMLFFGHGYADVDKAVAAFVVDEEWEEEKGGGESGGVVARLPRFIRETSETGLGLLGLSQS